MAEAEDEAVTETEDEEEGDEVMAEDVGDDEAEGGEGDAGEEGEAGEEGDTGEEGENLDLLTEENEKLMAELDKQEAASKKSPDSEALKGKIDDKTMKELMQIEKEAKEAANIIYELKVRIEELLKKEQMTEVEEKELEEKNNQLKDQMMLFDAKTQEIQEIITKANILDSMPVRLPQTKHEEDVLPRVIMCGMEDEYVPKIVVCHQKNKGIGGKSRECYPGCPGPSPPPCVPSITKAPSFNKPDKNEELEKIRLELERDNADKNRLLEELHMKLGNLQNEIHTVATENAQLNDKIRRIQQDQMRKTQQVCQPQKMCPSMLAARLQEYGSYTRKLERIVVKLEDDCNRVNREIFEAMKARNQTKNSSMIPPCRKRQMN